MSSLNYSEFCRLCLVKERVSTPIFEGEGDVRRIFLKIATCLPIKVSREDHLPKSICDDCLYKVENQYQFWNTTANSEKQLHQWLGSTPGDSIDVKNVHASGMDPMEMKQESMDMDQGSELSKSLSRVEAVIAEEAGRVAAAAHGEDEDEEEEESEEEGSNSEESEDDDNDADEPNKEDDDEDEAYDEELEPTTFVNVSLACDEAGPSGTQQTSVAPSTSTSAPAASGFLRNALINDNELLQHSLIPRVDLYPIKSEEIGSYSELRIENNVPSTGNKVFSTSNIRELPNELQDFYSFGSQMHTVNSQDNWKKTGVPLKKLTIFEHLQYKCLLPGCSASYYKQAQYDRHLKSHCKTSSRKGLLQYKCNFCVQLFDSKKSLKLHEATHQMQSLNIPIPSVKSANDKLVEEHTVTNIKIPVTSSNASYCDICCKTFKSPFYLKQHQYRHSNERPFKCELCDKSFKRSSNLYNHSVVHSGNKKFKCEHCNYSAINSNALAEHTVRRHTHNYDFACEMCGKPFFCAADLKEHHVTHGEKKIKCNICGALFHFQSGLKSHSKVHDPNKSKSRLCDICGKSFGGTTQLNKHMQSHLGTNKFKCETCGKVMTSLCSLKDHERLHTGEKPFSCDVCGKSFSSKKVKRLHQRSHSGVKPYKCDECGKCYTQRSTLTIHWRSHTGVKPFACEICLKRFVTKTLLKTHEKKHDACL